MHGDMYLIVHTCNIWEYTIVKPVGHNIQLELLEYVFMKKNNSYGWVKAHF